MLRVSRDTSHAETLVRNQWNIYRTMLFRKANALFISTLVRWYADLDVCSIPNYLLRFVCSATLVRTGSWCRVVGVEALLLSGAGSNQQC